jgi:two-component system, LuxR family, sensor histidine kinase TtrS
MEFESIFYGYTADNLLFGELVLFKLKRRIRMKTLKTSLITIFMVTLFILVHGQAAAETTVKIGVLAKRGTSKAMAKWGPTAQYLTTAVKRPFEIVPLKFTEIETALRANRIDFLLANPAFFARFETKYNLTAINTMLNRRLSNALDKFGGVVFTRKGSKINRLKDIRGKRFMCVKYTSFGGAHMAWRLLLRNGIDPKKDCSAFLEGGTHDNVVLAVKSGKVDVGTVRTDTLERMAAEGKIQMADFNVIEPVKDGFKFVHSTRLYPEWPFVACSNTDIALRKKVSKSLYLLSGKHPAMKSASVYGWIRPLNYNEVTECLKALGLM